MGEIKTEIMGEKKQKDKKPESLKDYSIEKLNDLMKNAIDKEDYERAAKIRDELGRRN